MVVQSLYNETYRQKVAEKAALVYINDTIPGITRVRRGKGFSYYLPDQTHIKDATIVKRINALAIPPAYNNVWICPMDNGHIQATGRDAKNRKQYRYHTDWEALRDQVKFERVYEFGKCLPEIRKIVDSHLADRTLSRNRVLAALIKIMDISYIRVGNKAYAENNGTYGLTTLRKKHLNFENGSAVLEFDGKNKTHWHIDLKDKKLTRTLHKCEEIPGYSLFKYIDKDGDKHVIDSQDLNDYLREITGGLAFTAKDFRTWAACKEIFSRLLELEVPTTKRDQAIAINAQIKEVAKLMGHTVAVSKKSYIHPHLIEHWQAGDLLKWSKKNSSKFELAEEAFLMWWKKHI